MVSFMPMIFMLTFFLFDFSDMAGQEGGKANHFEQQATIQ